MFPPTVSDGRHFVPKGWGWEDWVVNESFCGKILFVKQGKKCSWHKHAVKDEVFYVQSGELLVRLIPPEQLAEQMKFLGLTVEERLASHHAYTLRPGMSLRVSPGTAHQFEAALDTYLFEFSTHHDDADSIRLIRGD